MLLDSNVIIYAAQPDRADLRQFIAQQAPVVSVISYIEVLGYHQLREQDRQFLEQFFQATEVLPLSDNVAQWAVKLRQQRKMSLGDAIIAGTALAYELTLATHNTEDFSWIGELKMLDPLVQNA
jgi:hypothetical protein